MPATPKHAMLSRARERQQSKDAKARAWRLVRQRVLARDGRRCRLCGNGGRLDVHHIRLRSAGGTNEPSNLIAACRPCHESVHLYQTALSGTAEKLRIER